MNPRRFAGRVAGRLQRMARELGPAEREFRRVWPMIDSVEGWLVPGQEKWLFMTARGLPSGSNIVEIGSFKGRSTCCLALGCRGANKRVFAVDTFDGGPDLPRQETFPDFTFNVKRCGLSEQVEPIVGKSCDVAKAWDKPIHFLFIDGSHSYEDVLADFAGFVPQVVPGGLIAFHDVVPEWEGVFRAWHEVVKSQLTEIGYCSTIGFGRKSAL